MIDRSPVSRNRLSRGVVRCEAYDELMSLALLNDCLIRLNNDPLVGCAGRRINSGQQMLEFIVCNGLLKTIQTRPIWWMGEG